MTLAQINEHLEKLWGRTIPRPSREQLEITVIEPDPPYKEYVITDVYIGLNNKVVFRLASA